MARILIVNDDETVTTEIVEIPDPDDDIEPFYAARCRSCGWHSFLSNSMVCITESDAINEAQTHLDSHERLS